MADIVAIILAAGKSTRMKSETPKVLHPICGRPMIEFVLDAARAAGATRIVVIVGHKADSVKSALQHHPDVSFAEQTEQNGTGHAVMMAEFELQNHTGPVLILAGDTPLLQGQSLKALIDARAAENAACVIGTADTENNDGLGRVVRNSADQFECIVEEKDATEEQKRITEINTGCYAFDGPLLLQSLKQIQPDNAQAEYYLTDCPRLLMDAGHTVAASCSLTIQEAIGVNNRTQLAEVRQHIQNQILHTIMLSGVTIESPAQTSIAFGVEIGQDTVIRPGSVIDKDVSIGSHCVVGPNVHLMGPKTYGDNQTIQ